MNPAQDKTTEEPAGRGGFVPASLRAKYGYVPCLDGLRALSILIVLVRHFEIAPFSPGGFGVTVFFFVSGLLITRLLIAEYEKHGGVSLGNFYARRFVRLMPALVALVLITWGANAARGVVTPLSEVSATLFYYRNYFAFAGIAADYTPVVKAWTQTWSLAVEEHFYLLFPPLLLLLGPRSRRSVQACALLCLLPLALRAVYYFTIPLATRYIYLATETRLDSILAGCALALACHHLEPRVLKKWLGSPALFWAAVAALFATFAWRDPFFQDVPKYTVQQLCLAVTVFQLIHLDNHPVLQRLLETPPMRSMGRLSYSLYLWHWHGFFMAAALFGKGGLLGASAALVISLLIALVSYYLLEMPVVSLRRRLGSRTTEFVEKPLAATAQG